MTNALFRHVDCANPPAFFQLGRFAAVPRQVIGDNIKTAPRKRGAVRFLIQSLQPKNAGGKNVRQFYQHRIQPAVPL